MVLLQMSRNSDTEYAPSNTTSTYLMNLRDIIIDKT